jgi:hypothetical protein
MKETDEIYVVEHVIIDDNVIDKDDASDIIKHLDISFNFYEGEIIYEENKKRFSKHQVYVFTILWYIHEVNNGGHDQFYFNSTGIVWEDALNGFGEIGLLDICEIIKESANRLGGYPSKDREERWEQMDVCNANFDDLDDRFYKIEKKIDIDEELLKYIRQNREYFYFDGNVFVLKGN